MNILLLTKSKKYTCEILKYLIDRHHVTGVVCKSFDIIKDTELERLCLKHNIPLLEPAMLYQKIEEKTLPQTDLAVSNTFGRLIRKPLLDWVNGNCINLHGAILPNYKGLFTYNHGLLNGETEWGVTAHYVNEKFDEGNIIEIRKFPIRADEITVTELEALTQKTAYELTVDLIEKWQKTGPLPSTPQGNGGKYYSKEDFENAKEIHFTDSPQTVQKKIHAFWCPPYEGAYVNIGGEHFQLMPIREGTGCDKQGKV